MKTKDQLLLEEAYNKVIESTMTMESDWPEWADDIRECDNPKIFHGETPEGTEYFGLYEGDYTEGQGTPKRAAMRSMDSSTGRESFVEVDPDEFPTNIELDELIYTQ